MKTSQIIRLYLITIIITACNNNEIFLKNEKDSEAYFVIRKDCDTLFISYKKYEEQKSLNISKLVRVDGDYWNFYNNNFTNGKFDNFSEKKTDDYIFLSLNNYSTQIIDEVDLINDSILIYRKDSKFLTEIKSNGKPVKKIFYYDQNFNIDSIIWIISKDTLVYR